MTKPYAEVIGDPIAHSKSPLIHNFWLKQCGIDAEYRVCHVRPADLADYVARRRNDPDWRGCNITIPHKERIVSYVDSLLPGTVDIGAINTLVNRNGELFGANSDINGIVAPLSAILGAIKPKEQNVAIIGAGGAARAAAAALTSIFADWPIRFLARRPDQATAIAQRLGIKPDIHPIDDEALAGVSLLINASPLGMAGKPALPLSLATMRRDDAPKIIFDMVYAPLETQLLRAAKAEGFATIDGLQMLVAQAAQAFVLFFGQAAPRDHDDELRMLLLR